MKKLIILILILIGIFYHPQSKSEEVDTKEKSITVMVEGAVEVEGDYSLMDSSIQSLMSQVTLKKNANVSCINYDRILLDGDRIYIPYDTSLISLNNASKEELMTISGIGEKRAQSIIDARPFTSIEDIMNVSGVGEKSYLKWREYLCI